MSDVQLSVVDVETTTHNKGNVYDPRNKLCSVVIRVISNNSDSSSSIINQWGDGRINDLLSNSNVFIGFNCKFDLAWLRRECQFSTVLPMRIHDCQYAEYLFSNQTYK